VPESLVLLLAALTNLAGLGWLALAMDVHWEQACGPVPATRGALRCLRVLGTSGLVASLLLCLHVDHASMAMLVWCMTLAGAALTIAFTLTWRARWLGLLVLRVRPASTSADPGDRPAPHSRG
jgi:hypothetical protein